ncbi:hypothetical protein [Dubosiella newyorkensis]|uniref:hypothetical protein n=1 Tax=Dubosiella newyorkensis TaxID=1862672 RepID=UPI003F6694B4
MDFCHPDDYWRTLSVITPVGVLLMRRPVRYRRVQKGYADGSGEYSDPDLIKNPAYRYAVARRILQNQGYDVELFRQL